MGFELGNGTLYITELDGKHLVLGDISNGIVEIDTLSADETPNISYNITKDMNSCFEASLEISAQDLSFLYAPALEQSEVFDIEHNAPILTQARWHKKKRINKKWLKPIESGSEGLFYYSQIDGIFSFINKVSKKIVKRLDFASFK